ncbi:MAG: hypothetical protein BWY82_02646 [Verrucomicrobia bacterium ADurb.Bin474]|nr:MAG: hypothetical protein BWY82_02646 [Verrucomicrobia bacterium ADurb.Bin474]
MKIPDDLHHLDTNRGWIDFNVLRHSSKPAEQRFCDLPVLGNDDLTGFAIANIQRDLFSKKNIRQGLGELFTTLVLLGAILFGDLLYLAPPVRRRKLLTFPIHAAGHLHIHHNPLNSGWNRQRGILNIRCLFPENGPEKFLFRCQLGLALRSDFSNQNVTRLNLGTHANDPVMIEVFQCFLTDVRNIIRDFFRSKLGVPRRDIKFLNVNRCVDVFFDQLFTQKDRVLKVISIPRHESHQNVSTKSEFSLVGACSVSDHLSGRYLFAFLDNRLLVETCPRI